MILILGVTASGKGRFAFDLAQSLDAEIISIDSMKVYRRMDIGTAKPPQEARRGIKYHLIDIVEPSDSFSVAAFLDAASEAIKQTKSRKKKDYCGRRNRSVHKGPAVWPFRRPRNQSANPG